MWIRQNPRSSPDCPLCRPRRTCSCSFPNPPSTMTKQKTDEGFLDRIKIWAVQAMFADDELLEELVLKGGNAMALIHKISARASVDLDFSLKQDFGESTADVEARINNTLAETFREHGLEVFDFKMMEKPKAISDDMKDFWGGYAVEFKLATSDVFKEWSTDLDTLRRRAINLGQGTKFLIDISRFEYTDGKQAVDFEGYVIYVYSPEMIVCEKLRAICQQMEEYGPIIKRGRAGSARPKDFVDIFVLIDKLKLNLSNDKMRQMLVSMFEVKKVPLNFLANIRNTFDFHSAGFPAVKSTVAADFPLQDFRFYFDFTVDLVKSLEALWNVQPPPLVESR